MNLSQLKSDVNMLCGATSATYLDADKVRNMNIAYHDVARLIWDSADGWSYDDRNNSTLPRAYTTLTHNTQDYAIPSTAQRVQRIEVKDSTGNWLKLSPIDLLDIPNASPEYLGGTAGTPVSYDLIGNRIMLYPIPHSGHVTLASGMAVYMDRDVTEFATTATTTTPGFATPFHRLLSLAAAIDFVQDDKQKAFLAAQRQRLEQGLVRFYARRSVENQTRIKPAGAKRWRKYL